MYIEIMKMDVMQVKTDAIGRRIGTLANAEYERTLEGINERQNISHQDELTYKLLKSEVKLFGVEGLTDGEYSIELFRRTYIAASYVAEGKALPRYESQDCFTYTGSKIDDRH